MATKTTPSTGSRGSVHLGEETVAGVPVAPTHLVDFTSESLQNSESTILSESIRGDRGRHKLIRGNEDPQGDINFEVSAEGYGLIYKHALGDYISANAVDGNYHCRQLGSAYYDVTGGTENPDILLLNDDAYDDFPVNGQVAIFYRDANNALAVDDNAGAGHDYFDIVPTSQVSEISAVSLSATVDGTLCTTITVSGVYVGNTLTALTAARGDGDTDLGAGFLELGPNRVLVAYFNASVSGTDVTFALEPGSATYQVVAATGVMTDGTTLAAGQVAIVRASLSAQDLSSTPGLAVGSWFMLHDDANLDGVYTHFFQRGRELPEGMTVEVDRDGAIFTYTGNKVNTLTLNYETNAIVQGTANFVALEELAAAYLVEDVIIGATSIKCLTAHVDHWPTAGTITIGERTDITYTGKTDNGDGTTTLTGVSGVDRTSPFGLNVDLRTSAKAGTVYSSDITPLTSFDTTIFIDGFYEEVLSASVTLNNNLNTDKFGLGQRTRLATIEEIADVEGEIQVEFDDLKNYVKFQEGTFFAIELGAISGADDGELLDANGNLTGVSAAMYVYCPKCKFNGDTPVIEGQSYIEHAMPFTAIVDDAGVCTDLTIITVNNQQYDASTP